MAKSSKRRHGNPDFRHRVPGPLPTIAEIEAELTALLTPALFAPRQLERRDPRNPERLIRLRARILTLPVMVALIVSLVWRRLGAIAEVRRVVGQDGLLWVSPLPVSEQAIAKRPRAHGAEWRAPEHRSREAQRAACRSAPGRRSRQALAAASAESEGP